MVDAKPCLRNDHEGVFYTAELFLNDHAHVANTVRRIITYFDSISADLYIIKMLPDDSWEEAVKDGGRISKAEMLNILDESDGHYE